MTTAVVISIFSSSHLSKLTSLTDTFAVRNRGAYEYNRIWKFWWIFTEITCMTTTIIYHDTKSASRKLRSHIEHISLI